MSTPMFTPMFRMSRTYTIAAILLCGVFFLPAAGAGAQEGNDIWSGVFTAEQSRRGRENYLISCDRCHAQDLAGLTAPALKGEEFMRNWEGGSLNRLFTKIRDTMPPNFGSPLTDEAKLEVLAFILETNGFPTGASPLALDVARLDGIQLLRESGQMPNFSLVEVVGCLEPGPADNWTLTRSSAPIARGEPRLGSEDLATAASRSLGTETVRLVSVRTLEPARHDGHKMAARGLFYRDERESLLNVTSLEMVDTDCGE
jgi:hypothetical protein